MCQLRPTTKFRRDVRRCKKRGFDIDRLTTALEILTETGRLPDAYRPHSLGGNYKNCIDAHIAPDWVLIYEILVIDDVRVVVLRRTGTHQDVFKTY